MQPRKTLITIDDTARALYFLAKHDTKWPEDRLINCGSDQYLSIEQLAHLIRKRAEKILHKELSVKVGDSLVDGNFDFQFNINRLELLGFQWNNNFTNEIDKTLTMYADWFANK